MSNLSRKGQNIIDDLFIQNGYVLNFSNATFRKFVYESIKIDIYSDEGYEEYASKGNKLRQLIENEPDYKIVKFVNELIEYFIDSKLRFDEKLTGYENKKISELRNEIEILSGKMVHHVIVEEDLKSKFQMISTRSAGFEEMSQDEKLKEIANLIEHLLKQEEKFIDVDVEKASAGFIKNDQVKELRKKLQSFRHATNENLEIRKSYQDMQKKALIDFGITVCNTIYRIVMSECE